MATALVIAAMLLLDLAFGAFLGAGETARPDRIHRPNVAVYVVVGLACDPLHGLRRRAWHPDDWRWVALARLWRRAAPLRDLWRDPESRVRRAGFGLVEGSPCLPYQHGYALDERWWMEAERLAPLASLYGLGLGVVACCAVLVGRLPSLRPRPFALA